MTTPAHDVPMTPERWRKVDAVLQVALTCDPPQRDDVIVAACGTDEALRAEVVSLLAAHLDDDDFLERSAAPAIGASGGPRSPIVSRQRSRVATPSSAR